MTRSNDRTIASIHCALATLSAIAWASPAIASDAVPRDGASAANLAATAPIEPARPGADDAAAHATTTAAPEVAPSSRYPRAVIARPLTLPAQLGMLGADTSANRDFSAMAGAPILGFGITDALEVQVPYAFATKELELKGTLNVDVGGMVLRGAAGGKLEAIARVRGGYNLLTETTTPLMIGVHVQYNLTDTLAVISGVPGSQQLRIALEDDATLGQPVDLSLPIGVGYQPASTLYLQLDTRLLQLDLHDSATVVLGADATPLTLTAVYNLLPALDLQAALATDLSNEPGDSLSFLVGARYYAGAL